MDFWVRAVEVSSNISTPLTISALALTLFFGMAYKIVGRADFRRMSGRGNENVLLSLLRGAFWLSALGLVLGVLAWLFANLIGPNLVHDSVTDYLQRKDFPQLVAVAEPYLEKNPSDDFVRHKLGTSYYALKMYRSGIILYTDMEKLYAAQEDCSPEKSAAISSLVVFKAKKREVADALTDSERLWHCPNVAEPYVYNHLLLLAENHKPLALPDGFTFKDTYWNSKYNLIRYAVGIDSSTLSRTKLEPLLLEAYCGDERVKKLVQLRFATGDFSSSPVLVQDFDYEIEALNKLTDSEKKALLTMLAGSDCLKTRGST